MWLSENYALPVVGRIEESLHLPAELVRRRAGGRRRRRARRGAGDPGRCSRRSPRCSRGSWSSPRASDYADAKLLALGAPAVVFLALCGALALRGRLRWVGRGGGRGRRRSPCSPSAAWAYHGVRIAPVDRMQRAGGRGRPRRGPRAGHARRGRGVRASTTGAARRSSTSGSSRSPCASPSRSAAATTSTWISSRRTTSRATPRSSPARGPATSRPPANYRRVYGEPVLRGRG